MNRYQDMGLDQPNMVALDLVDLLQRYDANPPDVDISDITEACVLLVDQHGSEPVRSFLPRLGGMVAVIQRHSQDDDGERYNVVTRFLIELAIIYRRYRELLG